MNLDEMIDAAPRRGRPQTFDIKARKYGDLLPLRRFVEHTKAGNPVVYWVCLCTSGRHFGTVDDDPLFQFPDTIRGRLCKVAYPALQQGRTRSCGCMRHGKGNHRKRKEGEPAWTYATPDDYTKFGLPVPDEVTQQLARAEQIATEKARPLTEQELMDLDDGVPWIDSSGGTIVYIDKPTK